MSAAVAVPAALATIALVDGGFAGFRAATGRNGRIGKRGYYRTATRRGLTAGTVVLGCLAVVLAVVLATASDPAGRYRDLTRAGTAMLWLVGPYAAVVVASLVGYAVLPRRPATFLILLGLGPMTLVRPWLTVAAGLAGAYAARSPYTAGCALLAVAGVLAVEPWVHRRWYREPA